VRGQRAGVNRVVQFHHCVFPLIPMAYNDRDWPSLRADGPALSVAR
jgi:hypothetical protein